MSAGRNPKREKGKGRRDALPKVERGEPQRIPQNVAAIAFAASRHFNAQKPRPKTTARRVKQPWKPGEPKP